MSDGYKKKEKRKREKEQQKGEGRGGVVHCSLMTLFALE